MLSAKHLTCLKILQEEMNKSAQKIWAPSLLFKQGKKEKVINQESKIDNKYWISRLYEDIKILTRKKVLPKPNQF